MDAEAVQFHRGDVLARRYYVDRLLGLGGMGAVYAVRDQVREREIALKVLLPSLLARTEALRRFREEAEILLDLQHDGIVRVFDVGEDPDRGLRFYTMKILSGRSLRSRLEELRSQGAHMSVAEALSIAEDVLDALAYAHRRTVHRDIKPENIFLEPDPAGGIRPRAVLLDFGIAKILSGADLTKTNVALGTVDYMAPEQAEDAARVDVRADIYSLSVILYEALTGRPPKGRFKPPGALVHGVPTSLDAAILHGLETFPQDRPASAAEFKKELRVLVLKTAKATAAPPSPAVVRPRTPGPKALAPLPVKTPRKEVVSAPAPSVTGAARPQPVQEPAPSPAVAIPATMQPDFQGRLENYKKPDRPAKPLTISRREMRSYNLSAVVWFAIGYAASIFAFLPFALYYVMKRLFTPDAWTHARRAAWCVGAGAMARFLLGGLVSGVFRGH